MPGRLRCSLWFAPESVRIPSVNWPQYVGYWLSIPYSSNAKGGKDETLELHFVR